MHVPQAMLPGRIAGSHTHRVGADLLGKYRNSDPYHVQVESQGDFLFEVSRDHGIRPSSEAGICGAISRG